MNELFSPAWLASHVLLYALLLSIKKKEISLETKKKKKERDTSKQESGLFNYVKMSYSTADTCKNYTKCGKGFKIGTNEAYKDQN